MPNTNLGHFILLQHESLGIRKHKNAISDFFLQNSWKTRIGLASETQNPTMSKSSIKTINYVDIEKISYQTTYNSIELIPVH